jgi:putative MATE family efflux protein
MRRVAGSRTIPAPVTLRDATRTVDPEGEPQLAVAPTSTPAAVPPVPADGAKSPIHENLPRLVLALALPVVVEQMLHSIVGTNDTWLANHLVTVGSRPDAEAINAAAGAAVGAVQYILWLVGLVSGAIGTGATAVIARSVGARDRKSANATCGQAITLALISGAFLGIALYAGGPLFAKATGLHDEAPAFFVSYVRLLAVSMPLTLLMFAAGASLRGAGDTITPALAMIVVDLTNVFFTVGFTYGKFGLPRMGFDGIALGTVIAYAIGGLLLLTILLKRRGFMRLYVHRLRPHWAPLKRILRIGLPNGLESALQWIANFAVLAGVNHLGNQTATSHMNAIRIESYSFLTGMGFATAAATLVGQSLGKGDPKRARRCAYWAYAMGGGFMTVLGVVFIVFGHTIAGWLSEDPTVVHLTSQCVRTTGFIQSGFAAAMIFGFALRGAGDTLKVMAANLTSIFCIRFAGVLLAVWYFNFGLQAVWLVLCGELMIRGVLMFLRFRFGRWELLKV